MECSNLNMIENESRLNSHFISTTNNSFEPYQGTCPPISNINGSTFTDHRNLHILSPDQSERFMKYQIEDDYPLDLTLSKKIPESRRDATDRLINAAHRAPGHKDGHGASDVTQKNNIGREAIINKICAMIIKACLPGSNCSWVAKQHKISHQYFFYWCPRIYGMSIKEMKEHLKLNIDNDKHKKSALSQLAARVHSERMSSLLKKRCKREVEFKKSVITEVCKSNVYVKDIAGKYNIPISAIYKWCEQVYKVTLSEQRNILRLNPTK